MRETSFLHRKLWTPILGQLKQGATPIQLARSVSFGATLSLFPILGSTTLLCFIAGIALRLNPVAIQAVNYLMTPAQLAAIPVFIKLGEKVFGLPPISFNPARMTTELMDAPLEFLKSYGGSAASGIFIWFLFAIPALILIERSVLPVIQKRSKS